MKTIIVDYSEIYYLTIAGVCIPERYKGKFIQIRHRDNEYLVFSPKEYTKYHADLVKHFCLERGIEGKYIEQKKRYEILDPAWIIVGGGKFLKDRVKRLIHLYDDSMAYGKFDPIGLEERIIKTEAFSDYTLQID